MVCFTVIIGDMFEQNGWFWPCDWECCERMDGSSPVIEYVVTEWMVLACDWVCCERMDGSGPVIGYVVTEWMVLAM